MKGEPVFRPEPWYNPDGDCIVFQMADEAIVANRVDELLTVYESAVDGRAIGFQIKGVSAIIRKFGLDGLLVQSKTDADTVHKISITALLLAAYEDGPHTLDRRKAYAEAICPADERSIPADELQPA